MRNPARALLAFAVLGALAACAAPAPPSSASSASSAASPTQAEPASISAAPATARATSPATFVNRVWRVADSTAVAPGQLYVFLSEGTLVMASPSATPSLGTWRRDGDSDSFTMVEEGRPYRVDILALTDQEFRIRSHNPGQPVDIRLVPAGFPGNMTP